MNIRERTELAIAEIENWYTRRYRRCIVNQFFRRIGEKESYTMADFQRFLAWTETHYSERSFKTVVSSLVWLYRKVLGSQVVYRRSRRKSRPVDELPPDLMKISDICSRARAAIACVRNTYRRQYMASIIRQLFRVASCKQIYSREDIDRFLTWARKHYSQRSMKTMRYCLRWFCRQVLGTDPDGVISLTQTGKEMLV